MSRPFRHCFECFHEPHRGGQCPDQDRFGNCRCERGINDWREAKSYDSRQLLEDLLNRFTARMAGVGVPKRHRSAARK